MTRRSFFRSSSSGGGDGGGNKKRDVDLQLRPQQRASPPTIHHETQGPRPVVTIFPSQRHALASRDVNEFHPIPDIMDDHPLQYSPSKQPLHKSQPRYETDAAIHQSDLSHYDYASQPNGIVDTEMIQHETYQQEDPTNMLLHRRRGGGQEQYLVSAVENAVDEIWRCRIDDFRSASLAIQNLRLAILAEWENRQLNDRENKGTMATKIYNSSSSKISYDPSDTFLSLQGATLRFHAQFEFMKVERDADQLSRKIGAQQQTGEESSSVAADSTTVTTNCQSLNGVEWELTEQYAWEVWEEAIRASAALAHACVGPAWRRQLKLRRQFVRERLPRQQFGDGMSTNSGDLNMSSSSFSPEIANLPSLGGRSSVCETSVDSSILEPPTDVLELVSCNIPEVLPAAMIRFASSILETSIPPLRSEHTKIYWESTEKGGVVSEGIESLLSSLDQHLQDERRWLRRRKRLGDAQRDLTFGLFCGEEASEDNEFGRSSAEGSISASGENGWSIPGVHVPVMHMIQAWLDICRPSLIPKVIEERNIPYHFENWHELSTLPEASERMHDEALDGPPPTEIVLPIKLSQPSSAHPRTEEDTTERRKFTFWGELVDGSNFDWWYTLRVLRDCSDLVSSGWRPPPSERIGEQIILSLILIAERGISYFVDKNNGKIELHEEQVRKGQLVACSCASECLVALKTLAAHEVIPQSALPSLALSLCRLLHTAESLISSCVSNCERDPIQEGATLLEKEILTQQSFVALNSTKLLAVLLASETTACSTTEVLLESMNINLSVDITENMHAEMEDCAKVASVAIRALSTAMWGAPPSVAGVPMLRFFWEPLIDLFGSIMATFFYGINDKTNSKKFYIAGHESSVILLEEYAPSLCGDRGPFLDVVLDIVLAIQRLLRSDMLAHLCSTEWDSVVRFLDFGVTPWLLIEANESSSRAKIRSEAKAIFMQISSFLSTVSSASGFHPIVDENAREYLHLFCLRKVAPLLHMEHSIAKPASSPVVFEDDATIIALSVIKSWSVFRYLPFNEGDWARRARQLLAEAFLIPNAQSTDERLYIGGYLHSPLVRLEALKILFHDESVNDHASALSVTKSDTSASSMKSRNIPPAVSLFYLTTNLRELHLVLVNSIILPRLEEVLIATSNLETTDCQPNQGRTTSQSHEEALAAVIKREYQLRRFAIKLLGVLFRSRTGESDKRHHYIDLLRRVAVASSYGILDWARKKKGAGLSNEEFIRTCGLLKCEEMKLKLTAIRQLEACLDASFTSLPHTHANVPGIMKALCDTARFYISIEYNVGAELDHHIVGRLMMTLASILPIARLSCARNGQGVLIPRHCVTRNIPKDMLSALSMNEDVYDFRPAVVNESSDSEDLAPFVFVKQREYNQWSADEARQMRRRQASRDNNITLDGKQGTLVDFGPVASVVKHVLCVVSSASYRHDEGMNIFEGVVSQSSLSTLPSVLCTVLYTILSRLLSHGMAFPGADDLPWLEINSTPDAGDCVEEVLTARSQSVSDFAGILGYYIVSQIGDKGSILQLSRTVCSVLVHMSKSICRKVVQHACCGLILILSSLRHSMEGKSTNDEIHDTTLSDCAVSFVGYVSFALRRETTRSSSHMLIPLIDALREVIICSGVLFNIPVMLLRQAFLLLFQPSHEHFEVKVVAFRAAIAIINTLSPSDASLLLRLVDGPDMNSAVPKERRIQPLLIDLLRFRQTAKHVNHCCRSFCIHKRLARDALSLEMFPVDLDNLGRPKVSAWKLGNTILTLRLGSEQYFGWVEVVVRSPCSRIRRLVRWKKELIIEQPGSTLPFWEQLHPRQRRVSGEFRVTGQNVQSNLQNEATAENLAWATSVMASFDRLVDCSPADLPSRHEVDGIKSHATIMPDLPIAFLHRNHQYRNPHSIAADTGNSRLKRTFSDGSLASLRPSQRDNLRNKNGTVISWLQNATSRDDVDADLIHELEMFGFSPLALGAPSTVIGPTAYSDLFVHDKLIPFTVGSNFNRAISILDRITPFQTHRVGLLYGGPFSNATCGSNNSNSDGDQFLTATQAPTDFWDFASELGDLVPVRHCKYFSGGLDSSESLSDGELTFVWFDCNGGCGELNDPIFVDSMVVFHTVTLMPNRITNRKRHVGNDVVHIVYGLSMNTLDVPNISGQFGFITIYVVPLVHVPMLKVSVRLKEGLDGSICSALDHLVGSWLISRRVGAHFVRNLAMVADVICQSMLEDQLSLTLNTEDRDGRIRDSVRHLADTSILKTS